MSFTGICKLLLILCMALNLAERAYGDTYTPYTPLPQTTITKVPMIDHLLRTPFAKVPRDLKAAESLNQRVKSQEKSLNTKGKGNSGNKKLAILRVLIDQHLALAYFYEDEYPAKSKLGTRKNFHYKEAIKYSNLLTKMAKITRDKALARYHISAINFSKTGDFQHVERLRPLLGPKAQLPKQLSQRLNFAYTVKDVLDQKKGAVDRLEKSTSGLPDRPLITARLLLARHHGGLSHTGKRLAKPSKNYRIFLFGATDKAMFIPEALRNDILVYAISLWRQVEGNNHNWEKAPINFSRFKNTPYLLAIQERAALHLWAEKKYELAIKSYEGLSIEKSKKHSRLLSMEDDLFKTKKNIKRFESFLTSQRKIKNNDPSYEKAIYSKHLSVVAFYLKKARDPKSRKTDRITALSLGKNYLEFKNSATDERSVRLDLARVYELNNDHENAAKLYTALATTGAAKDKVKLYNLAIKNQLKIAKWPTQAPWQSMPSKQNIPQRKYLLEIFSGLDQAYGNKTHWPTNAQIGLLQIHLENGKKTFDYWEKHLNLSPSHQDANLAAGYILHHYSRSKSWNNIERVSRLCLSKKIKPIYQKKPVNPLTLLPISLLEQGKALISQKQFPLAIKKLKEFSYNFRTKENDQGILNLSVAYYGDKQYIQAIDTLVNFADVFQKSPLYKEALMKGIQWSEPLALEDRTIYFYEKLTKDFKNDKDHLKSLIHLSNLYDAKNMVEEAGQTFAKLISDKRLPDHLKAAAYFKLLKLELRQNNAKKAVELAKFIVNNKSSNLDQKAIAYHLLLEEAYQSSDIKELNRLSAEINKNREAYAYLSAQARYYITELSLKPILRPLNSPSIKDPVANVFQQYSYFLEAKKQYDLLCAQSPSDFCSQGLYRMSFLAYELGMLVTDFEVPATLPETTINKFLAEKDKMIDFLMKLSISSKNKAYLNLNENTIAPIWTKHILWKSKSDWNYYGVSDKNGLGFLQW